MINYPDWIPDLIEYADDWSSFIDEVYDRFCDDLVYHKVRYCGLPISVRRTPESYGKSYGFWHCVSEGGLEDERIPVLDRCKRITWIRAIIENVDNSEVEHWTNKRGREKCHLFWFNEEYLVVLAERNGYFLLKTAYPTNRNHTKRKLRKECDKAKKG